MGQAHGSKWKLRVLRKILSRRQGELSLGRWRRRREDGATSWRNGDRRSSAASEPIYPDPELGVLKTKLLRQKNWPGQEVVGDRGCDWLAEKKKCGTKTGRGGKPCVGCTRVGVPATGCLGLAILFHTQGSGTRLGQLKYKIQIGIHSTTNLVSHKGDLSTSSIIFY